jgi:hypothetical protein
MDAMRAPVRTSLAAAALLALAGGPGCAAKHAASGSASSGAGTGGSAGTGGAGTSSGGTSSSGTSSSAGTGGQPAKPLMPSGPIAVTGQTGLTISGLHITSTNGPCIVISKAVQVTVEGCEVGPCQGVGIHVMDSDQITVADSYVHPESVAKSCCDTADGIFVERTTNMLVQGNVVAFGEANIEATAVTHFHVLGNFLLNPHNAQSRGQNVQVWGMSSDVTVESNYALSSDDPQYGHPYVQEDSINFGFTDGIVAKGNYVQGGKSPSGCGLIADEAANGAQFLGNVLVDTGQCGIGISSGKNQVVDGNKILNSTPIAGAGNTGLYVWSQYPDPCGPVTVTNNVSSELKPDMTTESGYWNGGGCDPVTLGNDVWDAAARAQLSPAAQKLPPPAIPPVPKQCVAPAPWVSFKGMPPCGGP